MFNPFNSFFCLFYYIYIICHILFNYFCLFIIFILFATGLSAAGLYESVVNVAAGDSNAIKAAACTVWASLFSSRAVSSRKAAGIRQVNLFN